MSPEGVGAEEVAGIVMQALAYVPSVVAYAEYIKAAAMVGRYQHRMDKLKVSITVDVRELCVCIAELHGALPPMPPEVTDSIKNVVDWQVGSRPSWIPISVSLAEADLHPPTEGELVAE